jgi:putative hydrolase of the HAD superfamily
MRWEVLTTSKKVKALLIDSGRVLNGPSSGHWFISPNFYSCIDKNKFQFLSSKRRQDAFTIASQYISHQALIQNEDEEYTHFIQFYTLFAQVLPELKLDKKMVRAIAEDIVFNRTKYTFFDDVYECIPELSRSFKLAVVSDAWPSLESVFVEAGMRDYFSSFIISSQLGVTKPDERMFQAALNELDVAPEEAVFIDDSARNCEGAEKLGIRSIRMIRDWRVFAYEKLRSRRFPIMRDFYGVIKHLEK